MKFLFRLVLFIHVFFLIAHQSEGQDSVWTLQSCIDYAVNNNFEVRQYSLIKERTQLQVKNARNLYLPSVEGRLRNNYNWGLFIDPATNIITTRNSEIYTGMVEAEWMLYNGGYNYFMVKQNDEFYQSAVMEEMARKNQVTLDVLEAYFQNLYSIEQLRIAKNQKQLLERQYLQVKGMVESGVLHKRELLNMESQIAMSDVMITQANNSILNSNLMLRQAMGIMEPVELVIATNLDQMIPDSLDFVPYDSINLKEAQNFPETISAMHRLKARNHAVRVARSFRYPSLTIAAGVITKSSSLIQLEQSQQFKNNLSEYVAFNLRFPIFTRFENVNRITLAQLDVAIQENEVKRVNQRVEQRMQRAYLEMLTAHQKYVATSRQLVAMESQDKYAAQAYSAGVINFTEFNYTHNLYNSVQFQLLQSKFDYLYQREVVKFYKGVAAH